MDSNNFGSDNDFDEIRPYRDHEIQKVFKRLVKNKELITGVRKFLLKKCPGFLETPADYIIKLLFSFNLKRIKTVKEFQLSIIKRFALSWIEKQTTKGISSEGIEQLKKDEAYVYISNHRDIALDSAFINYQIMKAGYETFEIAFGDNLLMGDLVSDLIRINKSFIVKRGLPLRDQIKASIELSKYIWYTINNKRSLWIAQREGRAKDGDDRTNPAILKMLYLSQRKTGLDFPDFVKACKIVPVAISYEFDPCDRMKARELFSMEDAGTYKKTKNEDLVSIIRGFKGSKGRIHITFGKVLDGNYANDKELTEAIDNAIINEYKLWPSNYIAYDEIHETNKYKNMYTDLEREYFLNRYSKMKTRPREIILSMYAKPLINKEELKKEK